MTHHPPRTFTSGKWAKQTRQPFVQCQPGPWQHLMLFCSESQTLRGTNESRWRAFVWQRSGLETAVEDAPGHSRPLILVPLRTEWLDARALPSPCSLNAQRSLYYSFNSSNLTFSRFSFCSLFHTTLAPCVIFSPLVTSTWFLNIFLRTQSTTCFYLLSSFRNAFSAHSTDNHSILSYERKYCK